MLGDWLSTDRAKTAIALALLILLFTRALFRGLLIDGHDSTEYLPRVTEFAKIIGEHQFPPLWAPDLSAGHGQPLFEFAPPMAYAVALPFLGIGMKLADSLQLPVVILFAFGAVAVYLIATTVTPVRGFGLISFNVPAGNHLITVELRPTHIRRVGFLASLCSLAILLLAAAAAYLHRVLADAAALADAAIAEDDSEGAASNSPPADGVAVTTEARRDLERPTPSDPIT
jgi:hypothetical protein